MLTAVLKSKTQAIFQSQLLRQTSILFVGRAGAQILAFISYPILARWYSPAQFGEFAFINSLLAILLIASSGRYDASLVITKHPAQTKKVFQLAQVVLFVFTASLCLTLLFPPVHNYLLSKNLSPAILWILPILVVCGGYWQIVQSWMIRFQNFARLSTTLFIQRLVIILASLLALLMPWNTNGLVIGLLAGSLVTFGIAFKYHRQPLAAPFKHLMRYARHYRDFPIFSVPSLLLNLFSLHLPVLWLNFFSKTADAGSYSLAFTIISAPLTCLAISFGDVFYQRIAQSTSNRRLGLIKQLSSYYAIILVPLAILFLLYGDLITVFLLGESWYNAGKTVQLLAPYMVAQGFFGIFMMSLTVLRKQSVGLMFDIFKVILWMVALSIGFATDNLFMCYKLISLFSILIMTIAGITVYRFSKEPYKVISGSTLARN